MASYPPQKVFVLILHGYTIKVSKYKSFIDSVQKTFPNAKVSVPKLPLSTFSCAEPAEITTIALAEVDEFWDSLTEEEKSDAKIILVGHSTGALFARKAFLVACGAIGHTLPQTEQIEHEPKPWVSRVDRVILLAGINLGWTLSRHLHWTLKGKILVRNSHRKNYVNFWFYSTCIPYPKGGRIY